jgi:hypothetical protein
VRQRQRTKAGAAAQEHLTTGVENIAIGARMPTWL